jgi:hypothetical protein
MQADPVVRVLEALERERVRYVAFGAVAVSVHGLPRNRATPWGSTCRAFDPQPPRTSVRVAEKGYGSASLIGREALL